MIRGRSITRRPAKRTRRTVSRSRSASMRPSAAQPVYVTSTHFQRAVTSYGVTRLARTWDVGDVSIPGNQLLNFYSAPFQLQYLPAWSDVSNLYSQVRVDRIIMQFFPVPGPTPCILYTAIDYNNATIPANLPSILEKDSCRVTQPMETFTLSYRPRVDVDVAGGLGEIPSYGYLSTANSTVNHYGPKYAVRLLASTPPSSGAILYRVVAKVYLSMRNAT